MGVESAAAASATQDRADDRLLPETRAVGALVAAVLTVASFLLVIFPDNTEDHWAWTIAATMTAFFLGAGYAGGAWFFTRLTLGNRWHRGAAYFPGISLFTWMMGIATFLHWDIFNHDHISFFAWLILYVTTPFLVPFVWLRNRRTDSGEPEPADVEVPEPMRLAVGVGGAGMLGLALLFFVAPSVAIDIWPWPLTDLTARVIAACLSAPGVALIFLARDRRWTAWRLLIQNSLITATILLIGTAIAWDEFDTDRVLAYGFPIGIGGMFLGLGAIYLALEARLRQVARSE
jgi:hypothetical protein